MNRDTLYQVVKDIYMSKVFNKSALDFRIMIFNEKLKSLLKKYDSVEERMINIEKVYSQIDSYLGISEIEKKKNGEVFTPFGLINEMLDTLPVEVWSNPDLKWLDPANGIGNFPAVVIQRLMIGLKDWEKDEENRYKHIIENMIYVCDISPKNMFLYLNIFDPNHEYKMNYFRGSFLDEGFDKHMKDVWKSDSFNEIIGNPPYNDGNKKNFYIKFFEKSFKIINENGIINFVTPSRYVIQPEFINFRKHIEKNSKKVIIENKGRVFGDGASFSVVTTLIFIGNGCDVDWLSGFEDNILRKFLSVKNKRLITNRSKAILKNKEERDLAFHQLSQCLCR